MNRQIKFRWDPQKAEANFRKHGIRFEKAVQVFDDPHAKPVQDRIVNGEERWQITGMVEGCMLVVVAHALKEFADVEVVRIISARPPTKRERRKYEYG